MRIKTNKTKHCSLFESVVYSSLSPWEGQHQTRLGYVRLSPKPPLPPRTSHTRNKMSVWELPVQSLLLSVLQAPCPCVQAVSSSLGRTAGAPKLGGQRGSPGPPAQASNHQENPRAVHSEDESM